jgi:D-alanyl-D-alanine carboxypeptidase
VTQQAGSRALAPQARFLGRVGVCAAILMGLLGSFPAAARPEYGVASGPVFEWILLDAETGQVLSEHNADVLTYPASLTKLMTLYLTFEELNQGKLRLDQPLHVSAAAASRAPTKLGLVAGDSVPVRDLILGIVTKSANDAASVLAEGLAGSEANFARNMTWKARQLGMQHTWYQNASGLPNPDQRTTARDVARLALALYHRFPREYRYFSTREFDFRGEIVRGHDHLLEWYPGADGLKTGFVNASGFNLATSAVRDGRRLIGVIMGGRSARSRDVQMGSLLDQGFAVLAAGQPAPSRYAPLVAAAAPAARPIAAATASAVALAASAPAAAIASAAPASAATDPIIGAPARSGFLGKVAKAALRHLAPVARAEAATLAREPAASAPDWAIQLGAFRGEAAAEHAVRHMAALAILNGKSRHILAPAKTDASRLYRAVLLHFTPKGAQAACAELHHRGIACSIVHPGALRLASR